MISLHYFKNVMTQVFFFFIKPILQKDVLKAERGTDSLKGLQPLRGHFVADCILFLLIVLLLRDST